MAKKKNKKIVPTESQLDTIRFYWNRMETLESRFYKDLELLEQEMEEDTKIKGIEFFWCNNEIVGVGNFARTMDLIQNLR